MQKIKSNRVNAVFERDFNEYKKGKSFKILVSLFILATIGICIKTLLSAQSGSPLQMTLYNTLFLLALIPTIITIPLFTTASLTRDKVNGTMANLLATPLSPKEIVHGKSLSVFLPSFIISVLSPLIVILVVAADGLFFPSLPFLLAIYVVIPGLCYGLTKFTIQLSMIKSPEFAISPSYLIGFAIMIGVPMCSGLGIINIASWNFLLINMAMTFTMWILVCCLSAMITKERIILSK